MLIGLVFLLCLASVPPAGGRIGALADVRPRAAALLFAGLGLQVLVISVVPDGSTSLHSAAHLASYVLVAAFVIVNRSIPYLWLIGLGGALNAIAITANGGVMPADPDALAAAGIVQQANEFSNSTAVSDPALLFLGDVLWIPSSWPVSNVFSVGDVLIVAGAFLALHTITASRLAVRRLAVIGPPALSSPRP
jgi:hypothetical protein